MNYEDSLQQAITNLEHQLEDDSEHARLSLKNLNALEDYSIQYKENSHKNHIKITSIDMNL